MFNLITFSIKVQWNDKRYVDGCRNEYDAKGWVWDLWNCDHNKKRETKCPSTNVVWTEGNQFWLPPLHLDSSMELVAQP